MSPTGAPRRSCRGAWRAPRPLRWPRASASPPPTSLVKVDTEGAEAALLPALVGWLADAPRRPALFVEVHAPFWPSGAADAKALAAVVEALASYAHTYRTPRASVGPADLERFDARAAAAAGALCHNEFCAVLATDEPIDFAADAAEIAAIPFATMEEAFWVAQSKEKEAAAAAAAAAAEKGRR